MKKNITIGEKYGPAMEITDQAEANAYFEKCVEHCMGFGRTRQEAESIERQSLGYFAGYFNHETRLRVERLFKCNHPIFGAACEHQPTAAEAIGKGITAALRGKQA